MLEDLSICYNLMKETITDANFNQIQSENTNDMIDDKNHVV